MRDHAAAGCAGKTHEQEVAKNAGRGIRDANMDEVRRRAQPQGESGGKANLPERRRHPDTTSCFCLGRAPEVEGLVTASDRTFVLHQPCGKACDAADLGR
jgi:hypothetical protein